MFSNLVFGLYDVLIKGKLEKDIDNSYLSSLSDFAKENHKELFLISGLHEDVNQDVLHQNNLDNFFKQENIFCVNSDYLKSLNEIDQQLREENYSKNKYYVDDYFKIYLFNQKPELFSPQNTLYVGHDIWTDAFYLRRFTKINFVLLNQTISNNGKPFERAIKYSHIIDPSFEVFKNYLSVPHVFDYSFLDSYINTTLQKNVIGLLDLSNLDLSKLVKKKNPEL